MSDFSTRRVTMVDTQVRPSDVTKFPIIAAMLHIPREDFVPAAAREAAYAGQNLPLAPGRVVLEPRTLAKLLDALDIQPGETALVVGAGLGYAAALVAQLATSVVAVEEDASLGAEASRRLGGLAAGTRVELTLGPLTGGAPAWAPYDVILIDGAVEQVPKALTDQLAEGGRIAAIFMAGALGTARVGYVQDHAVSWRFAFNATAPVLPGFSATRSFAL
jgi:protein-L-isoaspartate(D-aspartate) O-methyltransferase